MDSVQHLWCRHCRAGVSHRQLHPSRWVFACGSVEVTASSKMARGADVYVDTARTAECFARAGTQERAERFDT